MTPTTVSYPIPAEAVPENATGILVFAWCEITGANKGGCHWHMSIALPDGSSNWFALMGIGSALGPNQSAFNSQTFWLPMPADGMLSVTCAGSPMQGRGEVEIHGYMPQA